MRCNMDAPEDISKVLGPNETIELYIKEKIYHPKINIDSVVITNKRIILRHPHALGILKEYTDYSYQDIANVVLDKGVLRSTIKCVLRFGGEPLSLEDLPNDQAEKAYGIIRDNVAIYLTPMAGTMPGAQQSAAQGKASSAAKCRKCGSPLAAGEAYCGKCGTKV